MGSVLGGNCTQIKIEYVFVRYLKIIITAFKMIASWSKLSEKLTNDIKLLVGQKVLESLIKTIILDVVINNSRTSWIIEILMPFLSFSDDLLQDAYIIFQNIVDHFEMTYNTCSILVCMQFPLKQTQMRYLHCFFFFIISVIFVRRMVS